MIRALGFSRFAHGGLRKICSGLLIIYLGMYRLCVCIVYLGTSAGTRARLKIFSYITH